MPGFIELGGGANIAPGTYPSANDTFITSTTNADLPNEVLMGTVFGRGLFSGLPANGTPAGFSYYATDNGNLYRSNGATWDTIPLGQTYTAGTGLTLATNAFSLTNPVAVNLGGTGAATLATHGVLVGNGTTAITVAATGTAGQVLTSNGAASDPTMQNVDISSIANGPIVTILARNYLK